VSGRKLLSKNLALGSRINGFDFFRQEVLMMVGKVHLLFIAIIMRTKPVVTAGLRSAVVVIRGCAGEDAISDPRAI
jgi:hypothetical protein